MRRLLSACVAALTVFGAAAALAAELEKLRIGGLSGLPRPDGFVVEDLRTEAMKTSSRERTHYSPPGGLFDRRAPSAKYRRNIGEAELNVPPLDLLVDRLIERYGSKLAGTKLVVHEFSFVGEETIVGYQSVVVVPLDAASVGTALVGSVVGTALLQSSGQGRSFRIQVRVVADLDGELFRGSDYRNIRPNPDNNIVEKLVNRALDNAFHMYELHRKAKEAPPQAQQPESAKPAEASSPQDGTRGEAAIPQSQRE